MNIIAKVHSKNNPKMIAYYSLLKRNNEYIWWYLGQDDRTADFVFSERYLTYGIKFNESHLSEENLCNS